MIDFYTKLSKKIAKLRLRGMSSWKPKHYKIMYAIQSGALLPPDMVLRGVMDPLAYPGTPGYRHRMGRADAYKRGIFNPHVLFPHSRDQYRYKEDPFTMGSNLNPTEGMSNFVGMGVPSVAHLG